MNEPHPITCKLNSKKKEPDRWANSIPLRNELDFSAESRARARLSSFPRAANHFSRTRARFTRRANVSACDSASLTPQPVASAKWRGFGLRRGSATDTRPDVIASITRDTGESGCV